ncbi:MAG: hypothetical protein DRQ55_05845 [Planctomycetota bacterium]|nr:MAG: hypothetical protein DRQ55_05845 [Planctomycetota bacterium]
MGHGRNATRIWLVVALSLASMAGLEPVRQAELMAAPLLQPLEPLLLWALPDQPDFRDLAPQAPALGAGRVVGSGQPSDAATATRAHAGVNASAAQSAWVAWMAEVMRRPPAADGWRLAALPVLSFDEPRGQLVLAAGQGPLPAGTPVTHRGVLLGFLRPARSGSDDARRDDGTARVSLLGQPGCRPVAAAVEPGDGREPIWCLVSSGAQGPQLTRPDTPLPAGSGAYARTRDVTALGDGVPASLLLGRLRRPQAEQPGGGLLPRHTTRAQLEPLLDPERVRHVTLQVPSNWQPERYRMQAHVLRSACSEQRLVLDRGSSDGVGVGDVVLQDGALVGRVRRVGWVACEVARGAPSGPQLVEVSQGLVLPLDLAVDMWPGERRAAPGRPVYAGTLAGGGLVAGRVAMAADGRLSVSPPALDLRRGVTLLRR